MVSWTNWSGRWRGKPNAVQFIRSEDDAAALVREADRTGSTIRVAGAGHSHSPLVPTDGIIADASGLAGVIDANAETQRAWVWAGTRIYALGRPLHDAGLGLINQGDIDRQSVGGAIATGTHGTGPGLKNLSASVTGARLVLASGEIIDCDATNNADLWQVARLNLGSAGLVTRLELQLRRAYRLRERGWSIAFEDLFPDLTTLVTQSRHFEFFWYPHSDTATAKSTDETTDDPRYPLAEEGSRCAWSYEVLSNHRPHLHTEMEYSVPAESGPACMADIRTLIQDRFPEMRWPVEYRTLAADDVWLSTAYQRQTVTISVHQDINEDDEPYFRACEEIFLGYDGRPHWGKVHYLGAAQLVRAHPRWTDWWQVRDRVDPHGVFMNDYLDQLRAQG
ncbi:MAG: D-arabinono-1,4-lactone oxidase [Pseudomonadales bacterium]